MTTVPLYDAIQAIADQYPVRRSAIMPALHLAQERYEGWLPPEALREVAEALDLTPAYVQAVASFYDMYHLEPVGRHEIAVCTNVSCALAGAQGVLEAFERELGVSAGDTTEDGEFTLTVLRVPGRLRLGNRRRRRLALPRARERRGRAGDRPGAAGEADGR